MMVRGCTLGVRGGADVTTRTSITEPDWVARQRVHKAAQFAGLLRGLGITADDVARFTADDRKMAEKATGIGRRSDATWLLTASMLAGSAQVECPFCGHGDPKGSPGPPQQYGHDGACRSEIVRTPRR
jgi:hypothetical protein